MMKKPQGLDKTVSAYYDIVYSFFPLYNGNQGVEKLENVNNFNYHSEYKTETIMKIVEKALAGAPNDLKTAENELLLAENYYQLGRIYANIYYHSLQSFEGIKVLHTNTNGREITIVDLYFDWEQYKVEDIFVDTEKMWEMHFRICKALPGH